MPTTPRTPNVFRFASKEDEITSTQEQIKRNTQRIVDCQAPAAKPLSWTKAAWQQHINDTQNANTRLKARLQRLAADPLLYGRTYPIPSLLRQLRRWKDVTHAEVSSRLLHIVFLPVIFDEACSTLIHFVVDEDGSLSVKDTYHPHLYNDGSCLGHADPAWDRAISHADLIGALTVLQQMRLGHDRSNELDKYWPNKCAHWWRENVLDSPGRPLYNWDKHTVVDPDSGRIAFIEHHYQRPLTEILPIWGLCDDEDEDEENDCEFHCPHCNSCHPLDDANSCDWCDDEDEYCENCIKDHAADGHDAHPCEQEHLTAAGNHTYVCSALTQNICNTDDCNTPICNNETCQHLHQEQAHPRKEISPPTALFNPFPVRLQPVTTTPLQETTA